MFLETFIDDNEKKVMNIELDSFDVEDDFSGAILCISASLPDIVHVIIGEEYTYTGQEIEIDYVAEAIGYVVSESTKTFAELLKE